MRFEINSKYKLSGDQPKAVEQLTKGLKSGKKFQTLLGVTGSGKTFTIANVIEKMQKPTLVIAPNKTLAAQLAQELRTFFPKNAVEYFVSYYDYYQPEAYIASTDTYIEKEAQINDEIDRLRHASTMAIMSRKDTIIVASVSCIYGLGSPEYYEEISLGLEVGKEYDREEIVARLIEMQFLRSDLLSRGKFRLTGETLEIMPTGREIVTRIEMKNGRVENIFEYDFLTGEKLGDLEKTLIYPAKHFVVPEPVMEGALGEIEKDLEKQLVKFRSAGKLLEADRLERRTKQDIEMMREIGYCNGIENYSRYLTGRKTGETPDTLIDYFSASARGDDRSSSRDGGQDFLMVIDESHVTVPQLNGMYNGDHSRKKTLVENGFRLPSAMDNRPLKFAEFEDKISQLIFVSATPGGYELEKSRTKNEREKPKLLIISGPWGSGKTTISKMIEKEAGFVRVNNDDTYKMFFPDICDEMWLHPKEIDEAEEIMVKIIKDNLRENRNVVVDYSGGWRLLKYKKEFEADLIIKSLSPRKEVILERYKNRGERNDGSLRDIEESIRKQDGARGKIDKENFIDTSNETPEETFERHFGFLKGREGAIDIVEQIIRPTGLIDPELEIKSAKGQVKDVLLEIEKVVKKKERVLITTLTKRQAEDLSDYLRENKIKAEYLHSNVETLDRVKILEDLRRGKFDVLVGVNLLREGLDLPEVSLVAILDADKEGFLRSETSLIQTIGRAARNVSGRVILYADQITGSMKRAISETDRRRELQEEYNRKHKIIPRTIKKNIESIVDHELNPQVSRDFSELESLEDVQGYIKQREKEMKDAARNLEFEKAALIRDEIGELRKLQRGK